jgi:ABC-2 type transport system ATP-binding protein
MKLTINNISKTYGKNRALSGFTVEFETGIYALLGPNGSGKTTLMNIITDNLKPDEGEILFDGENTKQMGVRFREKLGFMPQSSGLYPNFTVERFMWYMAALKGIGSSEAKEQTEKLLEAVELSDVSRRKIGALSGGMKQRLCLAQAVLGDPEILILDEPTAGLDPKQRISIRNYIAKIAFDKIVIIATHVVSDVEYIARDIIMLKKGVIVDNAPAPALISKIEGKVWQVPCGESDVAELEERFRVISIQKSETAVTLRVLNDTPPTDASLPVSPTLEDYYLWVFGDLIGKQ